MVHVTNIRYASTVFLWKISKVKVMQNTAGKLEGLYVTSTENPIVMILYLYLYLCLYLCYLNRESNCHEAATDEDWSCQTNLITVSSGRYSNFEFQNLNQTHPWASQTSKYKYMYTEIIYYTCIHVSCKQSSSSGLLTTYNNHRSQLLPIRIYYVVCTYCYLSEAFKGHLKGSIKSYS